MKNITIIIPSYNEEKNVPLFYQEVKKHLNIPGYRFNLLFVDDGSKDNTFAEIKKCAANDPLVRYLRFSRNFGKEAAMHAGLEYSKDEDAIIIIDCDLQQPPSLIPEMISYYESGYKIVYTKGKTRKGEPKLRTFFANRFYRLYNRHTEMPLDNGAKDFQLLDKQVIAAFLQIKDNYRFVKGIFSWVGYPRKCIEYDFIPRMHGKSTWSFKSLFKYAFNGMNQFSTLLMLLPVAMLIGVMACLIGDILLFIFDVFTLAQFLLGLNMVLLGLLLGVSIYGIFYLLYQLRRQVLNRPIYLIQESSEDNPVEKNLDIH
ncbi:MAG: glycosyltransferase family 2 protein [Candidatus Izemoplasmatales bacterium]|jgi:glycosyltransferase involved in cell wall biosynthesis|nr:glycosyltransferase family 2 protein [Candidatus Izemoplasmatales bacterium]MDD4354951.1 glycosyltransferase family 2 protein [Candidatus Izemoplasmatales bacterium]MDD4987437.1 glycosyltransferase family 2 protein [Candidatus Izemoplasmatales bacterium]NLF49181.1 glycosyltransferase family 2 protein [Acholeplasmataceae bacterium]